MTEKPIRYDVDGNEIVTTALKELINQYPGLSSGDEVTFSVLGEDSGKAMFPISGAVIESTKKTIVGCVTEVCLYPFYIIYRVARLNEKRKIEVKEWLDNLGKWLEQKEVVIAGKEYKLEKYPSLTHARKFLSISRQTPAYLDSVNENKSENWAIYIMAKYQYEYNE